MDAHEIEKFKNILIQMRGQILKKLNDSENRESFAEISGEHPLAFHLADQGAAYSDFEKTYMLASMEGDILKEIDEALDRIEDGTFGLCVNCGAQIHPQRLKAIPYATLCVDCKDKMEKGLL